MQVRPNPPSSAAPTVAHVIHSLEGGGMERTLVELLRSLQRPDVRHLVVTLRSQGRLAEKLPANVSCLALEAHGRARACGVRLARALRPVQPYVIHARNPGCWADATVARTLLRDTRLILGFHGLEEGDTFSWKTRFVVKIALRFGAKFTAVSQAAAEQLTNNAAVPPRRITVLPNGVDLRRFVYPIGNMRDMARAEWGFSAGDVVVGATGALSPVKRHDVLLQAFAKCRVSVPRLRLLLVGDGSCRSRLEELAASLKVRERVTFAGWREDIPRCLSAMDVYASGSDSEGMSNALLEAMAAGLPIVATNVGGNGQVVRSGTDGWLVPRRDTDALAAAIRQVAGDAKGRCEMGRSARLRAEEFSFTETVRAYEGYYYDRLLESGYHSNAARGAVAPRAEGPRTSFSLSP